MEIINTFNLSEARRQIQKLRKENKEVIVVAGNDEFNRKILENNKVNVFLSPELHDRKDRLKQRDSGLNEFLCKLAKKNNIEIGINLEKIKKLPKKQKAIALSRIIQIINLCRRTKTRIIIFPRGKYEKQDVLGFFLTLKSSTQQAKEAI